jgi:hypothetical protein
VHLITSPGNKTKTQVSDKTGYQRLTEGRIHQGEYSSNMHTFVTRNNVNVYHSARNVAYP